MKYVPSSKSEEVTSSVNISNRIQINTQNKEHRKVDKLFVQNNTGKKDKIINIFVLIDEPCSIPLAFLTNSNYQIQFLNLIIYRKATKVNTFNQHLNLIVHEFSRIRA